MKRTISVLLLMCLASMLPAAIATATETSRTGSASSVQSVDGHEGTIPDHIVSLPSLCGGLEQAIESRSGLGDILVSRGLVAAIPASAATQLGTIGTIHCYSDDIEGKIAIILLNESRETSIAITNDQLWANSIMAMADDQGNLVFPQRHRFGIVPGNSSTGGGVKNIDSILKDVTK